MQDGMRLELGKEGGMKGSDQSRGPGSCILSAGSSMVCQQDMRPRGQDSHPGR
jgi:hypothetical protein